MKVWKPIIDVKRSLLGQITYIAISKHIPVMFLLLLQMGFSLLRVVNRFL